jgi:hypothetical protein
MSLIISATHVRAVIYNITNLLECVTYESSN